MECLNYIQNLLNMGKGDSSERCDPWASCFQRNFNLLIDYSLFYILLKNFSRIWRRNLTTDGEGLQNLDLYSALRVFEQGEIFIVSHLLWHGASVFLVSSEGMPQSVTTLQHTRGWWGPVLTWNLTGCHLVAWSQAIISLGFIFTTCNIQSKGIELEINGTSIRRWKIQ
jgi:hypothetical protein